MPNFRIIIDYLNKNNNAKISIYFNFYNKQCKVDKVGPEIIIMKAKPIIGNSEIN